MRPGLTSFAIVLALSAVGCAHTWHVHSSSVPARFEQLLVVRSATWDDSRARLARYQRGPTGEWQSVGEPVDVVIGYAGYAWGRGLHGVGRPDGYPGPVKREGDGRSPAGLFALGTTYGYADTPPVPSMPYERAGPGLRCVDDPRSSFYNRVVSAGVQGRDWRSAEVMHRDDGLYEMAITVRHNLPDPAAGAGSCIFLHVWQSADTPVRGCTAMAREDLFEIAAWLRPQVAALVALPRAEYTRLRESWQLP